MTLTKSGFNTRIERLFDENEKAHPAILNILLQVLDDGRLTDSKGRTVNFKNTIIVMTTNLSQQEVNTFLKPELRNRIDDIIHFNDLSKDTIEKIVDIHIKHMIDSLAQQGLTCTVDDSISEYLVKYGYEPEFGARPIKRLIQREILSELSKFMLENPEIHEINLYFDQGIIIQRKNIEQSNSAAAA